MNLLKRLFSKEGSEKQAKILTLNMPDGDETIEVYGDQYRTEELERLYGAVGSKKFTVSITRPVSYQKKKEWPVMPFVNVNTSGSKETTRANWLGYLPYGNGSAIDFDKIIKKYNRITAMAKIIKTEYDDYELIICTDYMPGIYIQHENSNQPKALDRLAKKGLAKISANLCEEEIKTGRNKGKLRYFVLLGDHRLGYISVVKSKQIKHYIHKKDYIATISLSYRDGTNDKYARMSLLAL